MKPDDAFSAEMLNKALEDLMTSGQAMPPAGPGVVGGDDDFELEDTTKDMTQDMAMTMSSQFSGISGNQNMGNQSSVMMNESNDSFLDASGGLGSEDDDVSMLSS